MNTIITNNKIYVYCLSSVVTGGCELLHQLVDYLNRHGKDAYIVYVGKGDKLVPSAYSSYNIKIAEDVVDAPDCTIVIDEGFLYKAKNIKYAQILFWWLSVDNAFFDPAQKFEWAFKDLWKFERFECLKNIYWRIRKMKLKSTLSLSNLSKINAINGYQSEYARLFLKENGFCELVPLKDYINTTFFTEENLARSDRKNTVLYNPKKGIKFTKKLIAAAPGINWKPIINMTRKQVQEAMQTSKVYIDFGNHPGKDRIPREAALNGCCVVTGRRGSAKNDVDVPIPSKYKFDEGKASLSEIISTINEILTNYSDVSHEYDSYRTTILAEKTEFESQIDSLFNIQ